jgi:hypothetical protein
MPGAAVGIFWVDSLFRPVVKNILNDPIVTLLIVCVVYGFVAYHVLKAAYLSD